jgi:hypothetical protein
MFEIDVMMENEFTILLLLLDPLNKYVPYANRRSFLTSEMVGDPVLTPRLLSPWRT